MPTPAVFAISRSEAPAPSRANARVAAASTRSWLIFASARRLGVFSVTRSSLRLLSGACSGIGAATARTLAADGATVAILARRGDRLRALADELRADGATTLALEADVADRQQVDAAVERLVAELGRLDTLVNNAGVMFTGPVADAPAREWDRMLAVNVEGFLHVTRAALPHLISAAEDSPRRV